MISRRVAAIYIVLAVTVSSFLTFAVGTAYMDARIQKGIRKSNVIDARVDDAFGGLCDILQISARPIPKPPTPDGQSIPDPTTKYGKALAEYNRQLAKRQAEGRAAVNAALKRYECGR